jgi:tetratricopeptide (TPR) repeat protein
MRRFVEERGAVFGVGIEALEAPYRPMEEFLQGCHISYVGLASGGTTPERYHTLGDHWTPKGHALVADRLDDFLGGLVSASATPPRTAPDHETDSAVTRFRAEIAPFQTKNLSPEEAIAAYRASLRLMPDFPEALNNLAWILSSSPAAAYRDGAEAVRLAERACALTERKRAQMIGTLAAAYAEAGRFDEAVATGEEASKLAEANGDQRLAETNRKLATLYRSGKPYHEPAP